MAADERHNKLINLHTYCMLYVQAPNIRTYCMLYVLALKNSTYHRVPSYASYLCCKQGMG